MLQFLSVLFYIHRKTAACLPILSISRNALVSIFSGHKDHEEQTKVLWIQWENSVLILCPPFLCGKNYHGDTEITKIHGEYTKNHNGPRLFPSRFAPFHPPYLSIDE